MESYHENIISMLQLVLIGIPYEQNICSISVKNDTDTT